MHTLPIMRPQCSHTFLSVSLHRGGKSEKVHFGYSYFLPGVCLVNRLMLISASTPKGLHVVCLHLGHLADALDKSDIQFDHFTQVGEGEVLPKDSYWYIVGCLPGGD